MSENLQIGYPAFIARSIASLEDFIFSGVSRIPCVVYCQFSHCNSLVIELMRYADRDVAVVEIQFQTGAVYQKAGDDWVRVKKNQHGVNLPSRLSRFVECKS